MNAIAGAKRGASADFPSLEGNKRARVSKEEKCLGAVGHEQHHAAVAASPKDPKPHPFYFYTDFSQQEDDDPLTPLTPVARVPNFPAKMHAILAREELAEIISWLPHGRAWKIFKPREFEIKVLPTYFNHGKLSSFIRQANGWGFRRISHGVDRNAYYHELFLRGMPHLCKKMRRPGVAEKNHMRPEHEPDLNEISKLHPVPTKPIAGDDSILLNFTVSGGPKARVPVELFAASQSKVKSNKDDSMRSVAVEEKQPDTIRVNDPTDSPVGLSSAADKTPGTGKALSLTDTNNTVSPGNALLAETKLQTNNVASNHSYRPSEQQAEIGRQLLPHVQQTSGGVVGVPMFSTPGNLQSNNLLMTMLHSRSLLATGHPGLPAVALATCPSLAPIQNLVPAAPSLEQILAYQLLQNAAQK